MLQHKYLSQNLSDPAITGVEPPQASLAERRINARAPVIKSAKVAIGIGQGMYNCLVLDEASKGVLVDFGALVTLPDEVTLQISNGPFIKRGGAGLSEPRPGWNISASRSSPAIPRHG